MSGQTEPVSVNPDAIQLETYEMVLLRHTKQGRDFDQESKERIFRAHLAYTLGLLASGEQVAAGPVSGDPARSASSWTRTPGCSKGSTSSRSWPGAPHQGPSPRPAARPPGAERRGGIRAGP